MDEHIKVLTWLGLEGDPSEDTSPIGSLLRLIGLQATGHPRQVAALSKADFLAVLNGWQFGDPAGPPTPAQRGQAAEFGRLSRVICGVELSVSQQNAKEQSDHQLALLQAQAAASAAAPATPRALSAPSPRKIKASQIINQMDEGEVDILDPKALKDSYEKYSALMGALPSPDQGCTAEQLSALAAIAKAGSPLYVDLAVWGPHQYRLLKKIKLSGMQIMPNGTLNTVELAGPPTFEMWEKCMTVFRTGCIQLGLLTPARVDAYIDVVKSYNTRYSHSCWHLVYQADVRMRLEHTERVRRRGEAEHS